MKTQPPAISIIIPVKGARGTLDVCLQQIWHSSFTNFEVIVVDDGFDADAARSVQKYPLRVIKNQGTGVSAARNTGACTAQGEVLFFIDSDIVIQRDTLAYIAATLDDPIMDGVVGVLSDAIPNGNFASHYKNLWMRYTYLIAPPKISLFYTSVAAIRRGLFMELGGFDENYCRPSVEDTDFGHKLGKKGACIHSHKEMEVVHLKRYRLLDILQTDCDRSSALVKHVLRNSPRVSLGRFQQTSVPVPFLLSVAGSALIAVLLVAAACTHPQSFFLVLCCGWTLLCGINAGFLKFLYRCRGWWFLLGSCLFLPLDIASVDVGILHGLISYAKGKRY